MKTHDTVKDDTNPAPSYPCRSDNNEQRPLQQSPGCTRRVRDTNPTGTTTITDEDDQTPQLQDGKLPSMDNAASTHVRPQDVLLGRGKSHLKHPGNVQFQSKYQYKCYERPTRVLMQQS
jgi:hypothetical protein